MKKKKSLYEPRKLTYEEHKRVSDFFRHFNEEGKCVFDLLRQSFGDFEEPVKRMAKAVNLISSIPNYCETKSCYDRQTPMDYESKEYGEWYNLYHLIGLWQTTGWK